jgi:hypothetical protein
VVQLEARRTGAAEGAGPGADAPPSGGHAPAEEAPALYGVAMLRLALELKRPGGPPFEAALDRVLAQMGLEEAPFRAYLERRGGLLRTLAQRGA